MTASVFVAIASYRDPDLRNTVESLLDTARSSLRIGVVMQGGEAFPDFPCVDSVHVSPYESRGAGWARNLAWSFREGEPFAYQCDPHVRMRDGWDEALLEDYRRIGMERVILSAYPASLDCDIVGQQSVVEAAHFEGPRLVAEASVRPTAGEPVLSRGLVSGSHLFAPSFLLDEVPYDPFYLFGGEEDTFSARAWTRGWDIWCPTEQYQRHDYDRASAPKLWTDDPERTASMDHRSVRRIEDFYAGKLRGVYGLGDLRPLPEFEASFGYDFARRTIGHWRRSRRRYGPVDSGR